MSYTLYQLQSTCSRFFCNFFVAFDQSINFNGDTNRYFEKTIKWKIFTHFLARACRRNIKHRIPRMILLEIGKENYGTTNIFSFLFNDFLYCKIVFYCVNHGCLHFGVYFLSFLMHFLSFYLRRELLKY